MSAHRKSVTVGISISVTLLTLASWQRTAFAQQLPYQGGSLDGPVTIVPIIWDSTVPSSISQNIGTGLKAIASDAVTFDLYEYGRGGSFNKGNGVLPTVTLSLPAAQDCPSNPGFTNQCTITDAQIQARYLALFSKARCRDLH